MTQTQLESDSRERGTREIDKEIPEKEMSNPTTTRTFTTCLVDVYMDAVLHPRAMRDPQVLQQEGWHYELKDEADALTYEIDARYQT